MSPHCKPRHRVVSERLDLNLLLEGVEEGAFAQAVREGLTAHPKTLPPRLLYDALGSILFDAITLLPEYYPMRAESAILTGQGREIVARFPRPVRLIELGSGSSTKTRQLLAGLIERQGATHYLPIDVSQTALVRSAEELLTAFPALTITGYVADYFQALEALQDDPATEREGHTAVIFLGSTIGNLPEAAARNLLATARQMLKPGDVFLLGADLKKPLSLLLPAYDDALGVTAAFNRNLLVRINRELQADFDITAFAHRARWNDTLGCMEMHLESLVPQQVHLQALDLTLAFAAGETIHTESSHKYDLDQLRHLAQATGFRLEQSWFDPDHLFSENLLLAL
jgi:dimethylhistidine N-methyltransferase